MTAMQTIDVRRADTRFHTEIGWLDSWHSFSFGEHYDAAEQGHGLLIVHNDDRVAAGQGFGTHGHRDMEIVTWVLDGQLSHRDSMGNEATIRPGEVQRMSAGTGVRHSEYNPDPGRPVHFLQMWVVPDTRGIEPGYEQRDVTDQLAAGGLVPVASGRGHEGAVALHQRDAVLHVGRLGAGERVELPAATHVHAFVARGTATLDDGSTLDAGDAVRLTDAGAVGLTAGDAGAEVVVWETT
jgi:quercetin 2,3-dioxygenase